MEVQNDNTYVQVASGIKWLPMTLLTQAAFVGTVIGAGWYKAELIGQLFFPKEAKCLFQSETGMQAMTQHSIVMLSFAAIEEFFFRYLLQKQLLTNGPAWALAKIAPNQLPLVHSAPFKTARVAISAIASPLTIYLFEKVTTSQAKQELLQFQLVNLLAIELSFAMMQEKTGSALSSAGLHAAYNALSLANAFLSPCFQAPRTTCLPQSPETSEVNKLTLRGPEIKHQ